MHEIGRRLVEIVGNGAGYVSSPYTRCGHVFHQALGRAGMDVFDVHPSNFPEGLTLMEVTRAILRELDVTPPENLESADVDDILRQFFPDV